MIEGLFSFVSGGRELTESYIKELHAALTRSQPTYTGKTPEGASSEFVVDEVEQLIRGFKETGAGTPPDVQAAWLHHRFTQIHPFQDGNGRVARALASIVMIKAGGFPLVIRNSDRTRYFDALEQADQGDLRPLSQLFGEVQIESIRAAMQIKASSPKSFEEALEGVEQSLGDRPSHSGLSREVLQLASRLEKHLAKVLIERQRRIIEVLSRSAPDLASSTRLGRDLPLQNAASFFAMGIAESRRYLADWSTYAKVTELYLPIDPSHRVTTIAFVLHGLRDHNALMGVLGFTFGAPASMNGEPMLPDGPVAEREFVFTDQEDPAQLLERFDVWLEPFLVQSLDYWRSLLNSRS